MRRRARTFGATAEPANAAGGEVAFLCPRERAAELADFLLARGAKRVVVQAVEQVFETDNPLYNALAGKVFGNS